MCGMISGEELKEGQKLQGDQGVELGEGQMKINVLLRNDLDSSNSPPVPETWN